jgi:hypothetical protein
MLSSHGFGCAQTVSTLLLHLRHDCAFHSRISTTTALAATTCAPGLGSALPHMHRDWAHPAHIGAGTGLTSASSAPGPALPTSCFHAGADQRAERRPNCGPNGNADCRPQRCTHGSTDYRADSALDHRPNCCTHQQADRSADAPSARLKRPQLAPMQSIADLRRDWARPCHHLRRGWARLFHVCSPWTYPTQSGLTHAAHPHRNCVQILRR